MLPAQTAAGDRYDAAAVVKQNEVFWRNSFAENVVDVDNDGRLRSGFLDKKDERPARDIKTFLLILFFVCYRRA